MLVIVFSQESPFRYIILSLDKDVRRSKCRFIWSAGAEENQKCYRLICHRCANNPLRYVLNKHLHKLQINLKIPNITKVMNVFARWDEKIASMHATYSDGCFFFFSPLSRLDQKTLFNSKPKYIQRNLNMDYIFAFAFISFFLRNKMDVDKKISVWRIRLNSVDAIHRNTINSNRSENET